MPSPAFLRRAIPVAVTTFLLSFTALHAADQPGTHFLITNNDRHTNSATVYLILPSGSLQPLTVIPTGGIGNLGIGSVATKRISVLNRNGQRCAFVSDAGSNDVAGVSIDKLTSTGTFKASPTDNGSSGIAVVNNGTYLYAGFTGSNTLATYRISPGCTLTFIEDIPAVGINNGAMDDMSAHGNILVTSYEDGSIQSFNISNGLPFSNGDLQFSTGKIVDSNLPAGVDITADGHYALFGGSLSPPMVEVSDISSGKLTPTVVYSGIGTGGGSAVIWLSPDETLLYISNFSSDSVTAAFFDTTTGGVTFGCIDNVRNNAFEAGLATATQTGTGSTVYITNAEGQINFAKVTKTTGTCSIQEDPGSPLLEKGTFSLDSIASFPPRPF